MQLPAPLSRFLAAQFRQPSGLFGRLIMPGVLNRRNAALLGASIEAVALRPGERLLDLGFGGGQTFRLAAPQVGAEGGLWGVDFSPDVVAAGQRAHRGLIAAGRLQLVVGDVAQLPLREGWVDAVVSNNTVYFWPDPVSGLRELARVLRPGGRLALGFSDAEALRRLGSVTTHGFTLYTTEALLELFEAAGLPRPTLRPVRRGDGGEGTYVALCALP